MRNVLTIAAGFALGAASGAVGAWYILKKRYEEQAQEEIDSVKEMYSRKLAEKNTELKERFDISGNDENELRFEQEVIETEKEEAEELIEKLDYTRYSEKEKPEKTVKEPVEPKMLGKEGPYVISPEEFGELDDYEQVELTYFADKVITDDQFDIVENVDDVIGFESLAHIGEYGEDTVLVRNDALKCDYEVIRDLRKYSDVLEDMPFLRRGVL